MSDSDFFYDINTHQQLHEVCNEMLQGCKDATWFKQGKCVVASQLCLADAAYSQNYFNYVEKEQNKIVE